MSSFSSLYHAVFPNLYFGFMILAGNHYKQVVLHLERFLALWLLCVREEKVGLWEVRIEIQLWREQEQAQGGGEGTAPPFPNNKTTAGLCKFSE